MKIMQRISLKLLLVLFLSGLTVLTAVAQKPAYRLFRENGKKVKYEKMLEAALAADIVLFGEYHTNPISHWLQLELSTDLHEIEGEALILGAEMFEADNQLILNEYLAGQISEAKFEEEARLWKNYITDYKPLILLAKENDLTFVATNIPRRYANMVFKKGVVSLDSLSEEAFRYMAPLPLEYDTSLSCYKQLMGGDPGPTTETPMIMAPMAKTPLTETPMTETPLHESPVSDTLKVMGDTLKVMGDTLKVMGASKMPMESKNPMENKSPMGGHGSMNLADAQAIKDATMSHFIMEYWKPGSIFIHYNGAYHSDDFESMNWFLKQANPDLNIVTISTVSQENLDQLEEDSMGKAHFIIAVPSTMTQTHR